MYSIKYSNTGVICRKRCGDRSKPSASSVCPKVSVQMTNSTISGEEIISNKRTLSRNRLAFTPSVGSSPSERTSVKVYSPKSPTVSNSSSIEGAMADSFQFSGSSRFKPNTCKMSVMIIACHPVLTPLSRFVVRM